MDRLKRFIIISAVMLALAFAVPTAAAFDTQVSENVTESSEPASADSSEPASEEPSSATEPTSETEPASQHVKPVKPKLNGFVTKNGHKFYYKNGVKQKGFKKIKGSTYYFDKHGYMAKGFKSIKKHRYYFSKKGKMAKGFKKIGKYRYYFKHNGRMLKGRHRIKGSYYYFLKNGRARTGFVRRKGKIYYYAKKSGKRVSGFKKIKGHIYFFKDNGQAITGVARRTQKKGKKTTSYIIYFDSKGRLRTGKFTMGRVEYKASKKTGKVYSVRNLAPVICQLPQMPSGCEITSWTMMANFAGVNISKTKAAKIMPKSGNPNEGFMGSPYRASGGGLVIYPNGLSKMTRKYLGSFVNMTGCNFDAIKKKLRHRKLVMVWTNGFIIPWSHTVALTGYDKTGFYYNDPYRGAQSHVTYGAFLSYWRANGCMAMSW